MTAVAGHVTSEPASPALLRAGAPGPGGVPRLADGVELLGEYKDSGYSQPPSLVRRPDGQVIQMSALRTRSPPGSTAPAARRPSAAWSAPASAGP